jgi:hypothetical protein
LNISSSHSLEPGKVHLLVFPGVTVRSFEV